jgi:hypothetical protein
VSAVAAYRGGKAVSKRTEFLWIKWRRRHPLLSEPQESELHKIPQRFTRMTFSVSLNLDYLLDMGLPSENRRVRFAPFSHLHLHRQGSARTLRVRHDDHRRRYAPRGVASRDRSTHRRPPRRSRSTRVGIAPSRQPNGRARPSSVATIGATIDDRPRVAGRTVGRWGRLGR